MASIAQFCNSDNLIRSNYYSDIYRAAFSIDGKEKQDWDIVHISIPFVPKKEKEFRQRFNVAKEDMEEFYSSFAENLKHSWTVADSLKQINDPSIGKSTIFPEKHAAYKKADQGSDIYIVQQPSRSLTGSKVLNDNGITYINACTLGARLLQTAKNYSKYNYHMGTVEPDSICMREVDGKDLLMNNYLMFSSMPGNEPEWITPDVLTFLPESVVNGGAISLSSDIQVIVSFLWTLFSGNHYTTAPNFSIPPKFASEELTKCFIAALSNGEAEYKNLASTLRAEIKKPENADKFIEFADPVYYDEPLYEEVKSETLPPVVASTLELASNPISEPSSDAAAKTEEHDNIEVLSDGTNKPGPDNENDESKEKPPKSKSFIRIIFIVIAILSLIALSGSYLYGKMMGESGFFDKNEPVVAVPTLTASPTLAPSPTPETEVVVPTLVLDNMYAWWSAEGYSLAELAAVKFEDTYEHDGEELTSWPLTMQKTIMAYLLEINDEHSYGITKPESGKNLLLVIVGNRSGSIKLKMTEEQLMEYFKQQSPECVVVNPEFIESTGESISFTPEPTVEPTIDPTIEPMPEPTVAPTAVPTQSPTVTRPPAPVETWTTQPVATPEPTPVRTPEPVVFYASPSEITISVGGSANITVSDSFTYRISDNSIAGIENNYDGLFVTGKAAGSCTISLTSTATGEVCTIYVTVV